MTDDLTTMDQRWSERTDRILLLRQEQRNRAQNAQNHGFDEDRGEMCDLVSELGSVRTGTSKASRTSKSTAKSAKNRRKNERKKFSTRQGSPHEQLGLLEEAR